MARYKVGDDIMAIYFDYKDAWPPYPGKFPLIYGRGKPDEIKLFVLKVEEQHKVLGVDDASDEEKRYDGYILTASDGNRWSNQWPRATYSQTDDTADRSFNMIFAGDDSITLQNMRQKYRVGVPICGYQLTTYYGHLMDGIWQSDDHKYKLELQEMATAIEELLMKEFKCKLVHEHHPHFPSLKIWSIIKPFAL